MVKEEAIIVGTVGNRNKSEEIGANEGVGMGAVAEGKCEAEEVEGDASDDGVDDVGEHYVDGVLGSDGAGA